MVEFVLCPTPPGAVYTYWRRLALFPFQLPSLKNTEIPQYSYFILNYNNHAVETVSSNNPEKRQAILCHWYPCPSTTPERSIGLLILIISLTADIKLVSCCERLRDFVKWPVTQFNRLASEPVEKYFLSYFKYIKCNAYNSVVILYACGNSFFPPRGVS